MKRTSLGLRRLLAAMFWVAVWQLAAMTVNLPVLLASPVETAARLAQLIPTADFWRSVLFTLGHIAAGYALAASAGILLLMPPLMELTLSTERSTTSATALSKDMSLQRIK